MRHTLAFLLGGVLILLVAPSMAQDPGPGVQPPPPPGSGGAVAAPEQEPPPPQPPAAPGRPEARPSGPAPHVPGLMEPLRPQAIRGELLAPPVDGLLRMIAERRPELAERLARLRRHSPERFREVLIDALMFRLEEALNEAERGGGPPPRPPGLEAGARPERERPGPGPETRARPRELEERHERLEARSHELAGRLRELRAGDAPPEERERARDELAAVVNEQFEVRSELRKVELERVERELQKLRQVMENIHHDLEQRERDRESIIQRRIQQLLGEDAGGW